MTAPHNAHQFRKRVATRWIGVRTQNQLRLEFLDGLGYRTNTGPAEPFATMSKKHIFVYVILCGILAFAGWRIYSGTTELASLSRMPARNSSAPYDGDKRIAEALKIAKRTGKYVLIQSSAQGCGWCHVCHNLLTTNPEIEAKIEKDFVYVLVDTTNDQNRDFYKKYANNTDHTLVLVVLGSDGKELARSIGFDIVQPDPAHPGNYQITPEHIMSFLNAQSPGTIKQGA